MSVKEMVEGIFAECEITVAKENTALYVGSGDTEVFATPEMIALVEKTAVKVLEGCLEDDKTSVGTLVNVSHLSATPIGMKVNCRCTLSVIDGRRLVFDVEVYDECTKVGSGVHERFIVNRERFSANARQKGKA